MTPNTPPRKPTATDNTIDPTRAALLAGRTLAAIGTVAAERAGQPTRPHVCFVFQDGAAALLWLEATKEGPQINGHFLRAATRPLILTLTEWNGHAIRAARPYPEARPRGYALTLDDGRGLILLPTDAGQIHLISHRPAQDPAAPADPAAQQAPPPAAPDDSAALVKLAAETRAAQSLYFRTRSPDNLTTAKRLENELDKALAAHFRPHVVSRQRPLFD